MKAFQFTPIIGLLCLLNFDCSYSQDLTVSILQTNPSVVYAHRPIVFQITILNNGPEPARDISIQFQVENTENNRRLFEKTYRIPMLNGFSTSTVLTNADLFYLNRSDLHLATAEVIYEFDPSPTNNIRTMEFTPLPLNILKQTEQWRRSSPFVDNSLDYGAFGIQLSNQVLQLVSKPVIQILCGENENLSQVIQNCANHHTELVWLPGNFEPIRINPGTPLKILQVSLLILDYTFTNSKIPWYDFLETVPQLVNLNSGGGDWDRPALQTPVNKQAINFLNSRAPDLQYRTGYPNIDLDNSAALSNPMYAGDLNASGIAASTNGFNWLIQQNKPALDNRLQDHDMMEFISRDALRDPEAGVNPTRCIESALNFVGNFQMPLTMEYQEAMNGNINILSPHRYQKNVALNANTNLNVPPNWIFLKNRFEQKAAVCLLIGYYDKTNKRIGGDWISVSGIVDHADFKGIYYTHDIDQQNANGQGIFYSHVQIDPVNGWMRLQGLETNVNCVWIESIIATIPDSTVAYNNLPLKTLWYDFKYPAWGDYRSAGAFEVYIPTLSFTEPGYLNIFALTESGSWFWLNRNVPISLFDADYYLTNPFSFIRLGILPELISEKILCIFLDYARDVSSFTEQNSHWKILNPIKHKASKTDNSIKLNESDDDDTHSDRRTSSELPKFPNRITTDSVYRGCKMPNIDLDSTRHKPSDNPDIQGDWNACGPAAAANSLQWLEDEFKDTIKTPLNHRQKMEELSRLMGRKDTSGVFLDTFVMGKLAFIDKYKLPIKVKFQRCCHWPIENIPSPDTTYKHSARCDNDTMKPFRLRWDWLVKEMQSGEDVELFVQYKDLKKDSVIGAHVVTVTGVKKVGGSRGLWYKDDKDQGKPGGTGESFVHWEVDSLGFPYLAEESDACYRTYVSGMVSESYDSTVKFDIVNTNDGLKISGPFVRVYPNPVYHEQITIIEFNNFPIGFVNYEVLHFNGQVISKENINITEEHQKVEMPHELIKTPGLYLINVYFNKATLCEKWIRF